MGAASGRGISIYMSISEVLIGVSLPSTEVPGIGIWKESIDPEPPGVGSLGIWWRCASILGKSYCR